MSKPPSTPSLAIIPNTAFSDIDGFIAERNAAIAKGDALELAKFFKKYNPRFTEVNDDGQEAQVFPEAGTGSNPDDSAGPEPEQPVVDVAVVTSSSGETPTG